MEQDSLEDFIKLSQNKQEPKQDESKIQSIVTTLEKKKESEARALKIVELLIEGTARPETLLRSIGYLNSMYYQDIIEERAVTKICGYPLCGTKIQPQFQKRYSISTKNNKVYDLDEYRYFCSIFCFNASNHVKNQLDDSPLWLREFVEIPSFNLLPRDKGISGKGVDLKLSVQSKADEDFVPVASFAEISLNDFIQHEKDKTKKDKNEKFKLPTLVQEKEEVGKQKKNGQGCSDLETITETEESEPKNELEKIASTKKNDADLERIVGKLKKNTKVSGIKMIDPLPVKEKSDKQPKGTDLKSLNDKIKNKMPKPVIKLIEPLPLKNTELVSESESTKIEEESNSVEHSLMKLKFTLKNPEEVENQLESTFKGWLSLDTLLFIHGENKLREILDKRKLSDYFEKLRIDQLELENQKKYMSICKKLHLQEVLEEKWDNACTSSNKLKPLPDYSKLKEETKSLDVKVKTFYGGMLYEADDSNYPLKDTKENEEDGTPVVLPLVDVNSQNALRRRVLLNAMNKGVKFCSDFIKLDTSEIYTDINDLVKTFRLSANNVVFKPIVWNYFGFISLKILALRNPNLTNALKTKRAVELENLIFSQLPGKTSVVDSCLLMIEEVDRFIENFILSSES